MQLLLSSVLVFALILLSSGKACADLAEATDFNGNWTSGSSSAYGPPLNDPGLWVGQPGISLDGEDAAEGRLKSWDAETSWIETTVTGPTTLYFSYRAVGFPGSGGNFAVSVNGGAGTTLAFFTQAGASPPITTTPWTEVALPLPAGNATVRWQLYTFRGTNTGRAYVDQVWTSSDPRPRITDAAKRSGKFGVAFEWQVPIASTTPATLSASDLPAGLTLDPATRLIAGTPTAAGNFEATLTALNGAGKHIAKVAFEIEPGTTTIAGGIDAPGRSFEQTGWGGVTGIGHDGVDSARGLGRPLALTPANSLSTTFNGPGTLTFWYRGEEGSEATDRSFILMYVGGPSSSPQYLSEETWTKVTVPIPEGPQTVSWLAASGTVQRFVYLDELAFIGQEPEIVVEVQPQNSEIADGTEQTFGEVLVNGSTSLTFTVKNTGVANLNGLSPTIDGPDAADFVITSSPVAPVPGPTGSTTLTVEFRPTTRGSKTAVLHIPNNDPDENPFDVHLSGTGLGVAQQPTSREVTQGSPVSFFVAVEGPLPSFQWQKDGVEIAGAVGSTLVIPSALPWHIGEYTVRISRGNGSFLSASASLALTGVPSHLWRGLVACYPFDGSRQDMCRPDKPAYFFNTAGLAADLQRGGVAQIRGKGWALPPLPGEPAELQGPGGYIQIPRPPLVNGEPFTVSFVMKEEGFSLRHGESLFTMGEGAASTDLLSHYWIGGLDGFPEVYAGPSQVVQTHTSDFVVDGAAVTLNSPWTSFTAVADGSILRLYRNGQLMGTSDYKKDTLGDFFMGRHWWENGGRFSTRLVAKVDDVRVYNRALTTTEIQELYSLVQTTPPAGSFESWVLIHGLSGTDAGKAGDPDRDGLPNWDEYCFGTSPTEQTASLMKAVFAGTTLTLEWMEIAGVRYDLKESSTLLAPWSSSAAIPTLSADQNGVPAGYKRMQATLPVPALSSPAANKFFRVEATATP